MSKGIKDILETLQSEVRNWLAEVGIEDPVVQLDVTSAAEFGAYTTNAAMRYAKALGKNPLTIAEELAAYIQDHPIEGVSSVVAVKPGFVNVYLTEVALFGQVERILTERSAFGQSASHAGEKWVIEHTSPNPNKAMHLGHLRNNLIGMGIVRLLETSGAEVVSDAIYNNRGIAIAKVMYGYLAHMKKDTGLETSIEAWTVQKNQWYTPTEKELSPDVFVTECYRLAEVDVQADSEVETLVRQMVVDWEANDAATWDLWQTVLDFAYAGINRTLSRLGSHWDNVWYEHEHYQAGKEYVTNGLRDGKFVQLEDGAVLTNLEPDYGLSDTVLLKKDGTSLYITQDIALTDLKKKKFDADKLVWVIGPDQSLAMKQLFAVSEQLNIGKVEDFTHVSYGYVGLKAADGGFQKMSSRAGTVVLIDDILDDVKDSVRHRLDEEGKINESKRDVLSEQIAVAAVKFAFLKADRTQDIQFDVSQSVDVNGDSGPYVLYTYVRTQSILRKAGEKTQPAQIPEKQGTESELLRTLLYFDYVVAKATDDLSVHHVAQYLLQLSSDFNSWYAKEIILNGDDQEGYRLALVEAVGIVLQNGLSLLGIETVDEM